ncbi:hypothetical protein T05_10445 [Trichinella murrelli]|uniref:Uncharacterized protein n=1 Tax=Trichinella murrelli TaxID=144512 RepID=A0A0V0TUL9_9BILA|nr:hypothetical protein T05_10445 [Trichinella murrelli]
MNTAQMIPNTVAADTDRANEIFPAENEDEDTEATYISIVCCFVVAMPSVKRETERKVNAPVDTGPSPIAMNASIIRRKEQTSPPGRAARYTVNFTLPFYCQLV